MINRRKRNLLFKQKNFAICNLESKNYAIVVGPIYVPKIAKKAKLTIKKFKKVLLRRKLINIVIFVR